MSADTFTRLRMREVPIGLPSVLPGEECALVPVAWCDD